ncbi:2,3-epoxybenzoyl-CoA dihydrolase [Azospirillum sp. TSO22-1]|uniref:2,3-epoxybenzoyl-CoA dihydrolase n=1 Tax=Azospirillum sp. TSO22-1 TaxID=716789 RepID=UPI000D611324|nr:2,3-epoxybenzoyl-CoA dihydrolase [Azospirillum sp. TSO22-1]PWC37255.1 benzoyl-CoA-dihydrodiol lyase [Azospirillum sp. TSO22-1]
MERNALIDFRTHPDRYRHWRLAVDGDVATLTLDVAEDGGLVPGYQLKLNSYDLSVDIELNDAVQRLRFEHPQVRAVIVASGKDRVFCAGANIPMLAQSSHHHKVNFCKFTNETRNAIEEAAAKAGQTWISAINGTAAGGGYELALATDWIVMADDGSTAVSLPEVALLAVLPGTGGLTRLVDKRKVRRDHADVFCTLEEGIRGRRAVDWRLVDEVVPRTRLLEAAQARAREFAARVPRTGEGVALPAVERRFEGDRIDYTHVSAVLDRDAGTVTITVRAPAEAPKREDGAAFWPLAMARELDDLILHLRFNETTLGTWVLKAQGDAALVEAADAALLADPEDWFLRETTLHLARVLKRLDVTARSLFAVIDRGSCFAGTLLELALAADRSYMLDGGDDAPVVRLTPMNFGPLPMPNGLTRLHSRFLAAPDHAEALKRSIGEDLDGDDALDQGLVTFAPDDIDWDDEIRVALEERAGFSPDALTGMEASLRFGGPETIESKIFARLSAWQNWIFQRPNAAGEAGALKLYGTGRRAEFDKVRV